MLANVLLAISGSLLLILFLGVYLSNSKKLVNRSLAGFLLSGFLWLAANLLANISSSSTALLFTRSTLIGAALIPLSFLCFSIIYTNFRKFTLRLFATIALLPFIVILFTPTSWNILSVSAHGHDAVAGPIYLLLIAIILFYFAGGIYLLAKYYRRAAPVNRVQLQYIFVGLLLTLVPAFVANGILPVLGHSEPSAYGPVSVVFFSALTSVAIVRHRLLDIRLVVARSLAYVLVLGTLGAGFALILITLTSVFFQTSQVSIGIRATYIIIALLLALTYQPLKRRFDKLTNRIFFRDYYDPQTVLDRLSALLVGTVDLKKIEEDSSKILFDTIRPSSVKYLLLADEAEKKDETLELLLNYRRDIVVLESLDQHRHKALYDAMLQQSIALAARLKTSHKDQGFMVLGFKQSGSIYSTADIRLLGIVADEIAVGLQNAIRFEEIQRFNITLQEKVDEATRQLRHVNHRLRELDQAKDEFISMASHQLRTPLTTIKGYLSMIIEGDVGAIKKEQEPLLKQAFDSAQNMVDLIADLLNVSRLQSGKFVIENKPTQLADMVEAEVKRLGEQATARNITLVFQKPSDTPVLNLDETKIRQVVMNFLDNAIYYTPKGGSITVELVTTPDSVTYTVTDTGVGVPKAVQHHLFSKFYRADNAKKMRPDGTGLGLFMAKKVIVAQGGAIIFKSTEGKGSTFGFSFPRKAVEIKA